MKRALVAASALAILAGAQSFALTGRCWSRRNGRYRT